MLKVLLLSDFTSAYSRLLLKGFLRYSMEVGNWRFYRIPLSREDFNDEKAIETVIDIAQRWGADAIMGQLSEVNTERLRSIGIPVILQNYTNRVDGISNITGDYYGTGEMAANYFLRKGYTNFAFYGTSDTIWSREREEGFCTRDVFALRITEVCGISNIQVPQDLAVLGVDNDEILCNMSDPPLSSIVLDVKNGGYQAAKLLHSIVKDKQLPQFNIVINPIRIERRKSTEGYSVSDKLVLGALKLIETENNGLISITEILNRLCVSRRVLEKHFRKEVGISIYQYILDYRTSCFAEKLLTSDLPIMDIAFELGYEDYINLTKSFKRIYQMTPTQYRNYYKYGKTTTIINPNNQ